MTGAHLRLDRFSHRPAGRIAWTVRDLDLAVAPGERVLLAGPSGAGKSTVLRAFAGLLDAAGDTTGTVTVDGMPARAPAARARVGLVFQDPDAQLLLPRVVDDVAFAARNLGVPRDMALQRARGALARVGLGSADRATDELSGGERQRVAVAGALATHPGALLLDEPTSMLDPAGAAAVRDAVTAAAAHGRTVLLVEHRTDLWHEYVDRVVVLTGDGIAADGAPADVLADPAVVRHGVWPARRLAAPQPPSRPGPALLTATGVGWRFRSSSQPVLHGVNATVAEGTVLAVRGPNGAGKSSLAALLGGLRRPTSGRVRASTDLAHGQRVDDPARWSSRVLAGRIGSVLQNPEHAFVSGGTVRDELRLGIQVRPDRARLADVDVDRLVDELLHRMRLAALASANPYTLSGGEQRRLSVAAAVAARPRVLVLDEPTFGQDAITWQELVALVLQLRDEGCGLAVATHDDAFVTSVADAQLCLP